MKSVPVNVLHPVSMVTHGVSPSIMKKLPWALALAAIPFIPDILDMIRNILNQITRNGYGLRVKYGQAEVYFNRADIIEAIMKGDAGSEANG